MEKAIEWKCNCGRVEYGEYPPEECNQCWNLNSFIQKDTEDEEIDELMGELL
jgi:hypothetical protein